MDILDIVKEIPSIVIKQMEGIPPLVVIQEIKREIEELEKSYLEPCSKCSNRKNQYCWCTTPYIYRY